MAQNYSGQKRIRKHFGKIREVLDMPNLIQVQKSSYDLFLNSGEKDMPTDGEGIMGVFQSVFPIKDFNETSISGQTFEVSTEELKLSENTSIKDEEAEIDKIDSTIAFEDNSYSLKSGLIQNKEVTVHKSMGKSEITSEEVKLSKKVSIKKIG